MLDRYRDIKIGKDDLWGARRAGDLIAKHGDEPMPIGFVTVDLPTGDFLVQTESKNWGREVPPPPDELFDVWKGLSEMGIGILKPLAIPSNASFYWLLIDSSSQPYNHDPLGQFIKTLRDEKKVDMKDLSDSRFGLSPDEIQGAFFRELIKYATYSATLRDKKLEAFLKKNKDKFRLPTENEFRLLFSRTPDILEKPDKDGTLRGEWLHEKYNEGQRLIALKQNDRGLNVVPEYSGFYRSKRLGFRIAIEFPLPQQKEEVKAA